MIAKNISHDTLIPPELMEVIDDALCNIITWQETLGEDELDIGQKKKKEVEVKKEVEDGEFPEDDDNENDEQFILQESLKKYNPDGVTNYGIVKREGNVITYYFKTIKSSIKKGLLPELLGTLLKKRKEYK